MKNRIIALLILALCVCFLTGCTSAKEQPKRLKAHILYENGTFRCVNIEDWGSHTNGNYRIKISDDCTIYTSSENVVISEGHCPICELYWYMSTSDGIRYYRWNDVDMIYREEYP